MKYYITADTHGFCSILKAALGQAGFFSEKEPHKLIILGDLFDRGDEAKELQEFILQLMDEDRVILIRGNHEDLFKELVTEDRGMPYSHHVQNGTYDTALQLTDYDPALALIRNFDFADAAKLTPYYTRIIPAMKDYYETAHYIFVHGWIPCMWNRKSGYSFYSDWRNADLFDWKRARWYNGMDAAPTCMEEKTILCGHWHTSYGHWKYEHKGSEFEEDADFSPYYGPGVIALDACTAYSQQINVITLEDEPITA